ncbi:MAG TPA: GNAT family N-acetyltransferase [Actinotalea sp.]|jgi:GNAT superfamily N-acetyltransferase
MSFSRSTATTPPAAVGHPAGVRVIEVPVLADLASPDAWMIHGTVRVDEAVDLALHGNTDVSPDAATFWTTMVHGEYRRVRRLVAVRDDVVGEAAVVGRAVVALPQVGNTHLAEVYLAVLPGWRGRGIGSALWDACLAIVHEEGRTVVLGGSDHTPEPPPGPGALESPAGGGRIPADDDSTRFALARGFALEQVGRHSVLDVPLPEADLTAHLDGARAAAGPDYRLHHWADAVPEGWLDGFALLETRMSTDAPSAGLEVTEDPWDAQRVLDEARAIHERGQGFRVAAAEHVPTGTLAAFTMVELPDARPEVVFQGDTLVLREHRGRRLGMLVKAALLDELARVRPQARRVHTWNAQENAHMLAINVALGFRPASVEAEWQLRL